MPYPKKNIVENGNFQKFTEGTSYNLTDPEPAPRWIDLGNPAGWEVTEETGDQVMILKSGTLSFNANDSAAGAMISQTVSNVEPNGEDIVFSFDYAEVGRRGSTTDVQLRVIVSEISGNGDPGAVLNEIVTTPGHYSFTFPANAKSYSIQFVDISVGGNPSDHTGFTGTDDRDPQISNISLIAPVPCFTAGTLIETPEGPRLIETLKAGDMVMTRDRGAQPIIWIGSRVISFSQNNDLSRKIRPIRIKKDALGPEMPQRELLVSPQHRMLLRNKIARRMFDTEEILAAAKHLTDMPKIEIADDIKEITYLHILLGSC